MLKKYIYNILYNTVRCFEGINLLWHLLAITLTYLLVTLGFDWWYFEFTRIASLLWLAFPAAILGLLVPIVAPLVLYILGKKRDSRTLKKTAAALGQAVIIGSIISSLYKAFTGRLQPALSIRLPLPDISRDFNFGFLKNGIFWGWPSSHATIAFAMAAVLIALYPRRKTIAVSAMIYALYVGLGVSVTIHWFSDFIAGAIIGTLIGCVIAKSYREKSTYLRP